MRWTPKIGHHIFHRQDWCRRQERAQPARPGIVLPRVTQLILPPWRRCKFYASWPSGLAWRPPWKAPKLHRVTCRNSLPCREAKSPTAAKRDTVRPRTPTSATERVIPTKRTSIAIRRKIPLVIVAVIVREKARAPPSPGRRIRRTQPIPPTRRRHPP